MSEEQKTSSPNPKPSRIKPWLRGVLFVSLALNLAVAGVVGGAFVRFGGPDSDKRPPRQDEVAGTYTRALSSDDRRAIWRELRKQRDDLPSKADLRADFQEVLRLLRAEDFDRAALEDVLSRQRDFGISRAELGHELLLDRLQTLTAEERAAYADRVEDGVKRHRHKKPKPQGPKSQ